MVILSREHATKIHCSFDYTQRISLLKMTKEPGFVPLHSSHTCV